MANITKHTTRAIVAPQQFWDSAADTNDNGSAIAVGDVFKISDSLNGPARTVDITTTSAGTMSFRTNHLIPLFPPRPAGEFLYGDNNQFVASGVSFVDASQSPVIVRGNTTVNLIGPINDIQIVTLSGAFTVRAKR